MNNTMKKIRLKNIDEIPYPRQQFFVHQNKKSIFCARCKEYTTLIEGIYTEDHDTFYCNECFEAYYD